MSTPAPKKKVKKKSIRDVEIGDHVRETASSRGKKRCGEVLMILQDNPGDPTLECVEVHPDELTPLEKGSDGLKTFKAKLPSSSCTRLENNFLRKRPSRKAT